MTTTPQQTPPQILESAENFGQIFAERFINRRPTINEVLMLQAWSWSFRGTCSRRRVGVVIADERGYIRTNGYNGSLSGMPHCEPHSDHQPCDVSEHAERNAIYRAARKGISIEGCNVYSTDSPCVGCARGIVQSGITKVFYARPYREDRGLILLMAAGVEVERLSLLEDE